MKQAALIVVAVALPASAQPVPPDYGFNFITIGDVGNQAYNGPDPFSRYAGRGSVGYEYRMAKYETRTSQFIEFMNVLGRHNPDFAVQQRPLFWGASGAYNPDMTVSFSVNTPGGEDYPVAGMTWRLSAMYCNWLHNDKADSPEAYLDGAYDVSTFIRDPNAALNLLDQTTHHPDAKFWIPSLDEWIKSVHYDPDKNGSGDGGWWQYPNGTDEPLTPGMPGEPGAETSYRLDEPGFYELRIPVGSYPDTTTPWGLLDASGGAAEATEEWAPIPGINFYRIWEGSIAGPDLTGNSNNRDLVNRGIDETPFEMIGGLGLRVASVPAPGVGLPLIACGLLASVRRRR